MNVLNTNNKVKVMILSIIAIALCVGILLIKRISSDKIDSSIKLFDFLPQKTKLFVYGKDLKSITLAAHFPLNYENLFLSLAQSNGEKPSVIMCQDSDFVLCQKMTKKQQENLIDNSLKKIYPLFPHQKISFGDAQYYFFATSTNSFFVCSFIDGTFLASYNFRMLRSVVDSYLTKENFHLNQPAENYLDSCARTGEVMFMNHHNLDFSIFTAKKVENAVLLSGRKNESLKAVTSPKLEPNFAFLPDSLSSFRYMKHIDFHLENSLLKYAQGNQYQFDVTSESFGNYRMEMIPIRKNVSLIDTIQKQMGKPIKGYPYLSFFGQYYLYNGRYLGKNVNKTPIYWSQWHNYLLISADMNAIVRYVRRKETYKDRQNYSDITQNYNPACAEFYYSENLSKEFSPLLKNLLRLNSERLIFNLFSEQ